MARKNRVKTKNDAYYHVVSRIAHQALLMDDAVKRRMLDILYAAAAFCGVVVGTYMLMDNHFHILVYVPADAGAPPAMDVVLRRIEALYGEVMALRLEERWERMLREGREAVVEAELGRYRRRMRDISEFVKTFKQRVTQWYNLDRGHVGTSRGRSSRRANISPPARSTSRTIRSRPAWCRIPPTIHGALRARRSAGTSARRRA